MSKLREVLSEDWTSDVQFINTDDHTPKRRIRARFSYVEHDRVVPDPDETLEMAGVRAAVACLGKRALAHMLARPRFPTEALHAWEDEFDAIVAAARELDR